ncbi:transcriptional regulator [Kitasatospora sp. NPDC094019]|uniref:transcriptional regulator n=1 Tax=Kitasatospora sp. NPDC094019 TaxID=3364091 RepID=UPI003806D62E
MSGPDLLLQHPTRLTVVAFLGGRVEAESSAVEDYCQVSDPVLGKAARALEEAGHLSAKKGCVGKRPRTWPAAARAGRRAPADHPGVVLQQLAAAAEAAGRGTGERRP